MKRGIEVEPATPGQLEDILKDAVEISDGTVKALGGEGQTKLAKIIPLTVTGDETHNMAWLDYELLDGIGTTKLRAVTKSRTWDGHEIIDRLYFTVVKGPKSTKFQHSSIKTTDGQNLQRGMDVELETGISTQISWERADGALSFLKSLCDVIKEKAESETSAN